jgi:hypothetical protein
MTFFSDSLKCSGIVILCQINGISGPYKILSNGLSPPFFFKMFILRKMHYFPPFQFQISSLKNTHFFMLTFQDFLVVVSQGFPIASRFCYLL